MRKALFSLALCILLVVGGCRTVNGAIWSVPKWFSGHVLNVYTGNGHYDGKLRWDNFAQNYQQMWNVVDIYFFNYDVTDPYLGAPFFGDPH